MDETTPRRRSTRPAPPAAVRSAAAPPAGARNPAVRTGSAAQAAPAEGRGTRDDERVLTDPRAIRALAHPARLAVLEAFSGGRELTATDAAAVAGLSASAMSYHLRALQKWGFVERAPSTADGRERPWRATAERWRIDEMSTAATAAAADTMLGTVLDRLRGGMSDWFYREREQPQEWKDAAVVNSATVWVTAEEALGLSELLSERLEQLRSRTADDHPAGARRVRVGFLTVPIDYE